jgi:hypothetical protein
MERNPAIPRRKRWLAALSPVLAAAMLAWSGSARAQEVLSLCTEEALRTAVEIGGSYRLECPTNNTLASIVLSRPLVVERDLSLVSTQEMLLDGKSATRLFVVKPGVRLTLDRILLFSGRQSPTNLNNGGIDDTAGGAIYNDGGIVTLLNTRVEASAVVGVTGSAGAAGSGDHGEDGGDAAGGAIYNNGGQIIVSNTVFSANTVTPGVGGAGGGGGGGFGGNGGDGGDGGSGGGAAIYSVGGKVTVLDSMFTNNVATGAAAGAAGAAAGLLGFPGEPGEAGDGVGAAIAGANAELIVSGSTFVTNKVTGANGLAGLDGLRNQDGYPGRNGGEGAGGAVYSTGTLSMTNCTFFGNAATGGTGGEGGAGGTSGFGADGGTGGEGGGGSGAAVETTGPSTIVHCTFSDNVASSGLGGEGGPAGVLGEAGRAGNPGAAFGGAIHGAGSEVALANSILAHSGVSVSGNISDRGGNLATDRNSLIVSPQSRRLVNPFLRPLAANGGRTWTMELQTNSPAIDRALAEFAPLIDQRGTNRVVPDIGAFEIYTFVMPAIPGSVLTNGLATLRTTNNILELRWPVGYTNLFLQYKTNLNLTNWTTITNLPVTNTSGSFVLAVNLTNSTRRQSFFRLIGITNLANTNLLFQLPATNAPNTNDVFIPF